ncbi:MAG: hypothetical protein Q7R49_02250 [Candidatus Daviesbacteria bacterium]|nr:hypothetical protein [Candidatus Daviesbacteria bacterium]
MLETLDRINIGNLNLTEPIQPEVLFDPDKEVSDIYWDKVIKALSSKQGLESYRIGQMAVHLKLTSLRRYDQLGVARYFIEKILTNKIEKNRANTNFIGVSEVDAACLKILSPDKYWQFNFQTDEFELLRYRVHRPQNGDSFYGLGFDAFHFRVLFPNERLFFSDNVWEYMINDFKEGKYVKGHVLAQTKIMFPDRFEELAYSMRDLRNELKGTQVRDYYTEDFLDQAFSMKVLAAREVKFTDQGVELVVSKPPFTEQTPALPEMRKF